MYVCMYVYVNIIFFLPKGPPPPIPRRISEGGASGLPSSTKSKQLLLATDIGTHGIRD